MFKAVYTQTTRGKEQLLFCGQPFIYEKSIRLPTGQSKRLWRCNQWCDIFSSFNLCRLIIWGLWFNWWHLSYYRWNKKCRARVYTIGDVITPLQRLHTHEEVIHRKKRVTKKNTKNDKDEKHYYVDYLLVSEDKKETSDDEEILFDN